MGAEELPHEPQPQIHLIACFLVLTRTCPLVVQTATSAFDGVDEMRLHSVCCLLSVWSRDNEGLNGAWVQAGTRPLLIHSHSSMLCGDLLSLKYRCDPRTKAAVCSVISSPKLVFLIAFCCVYLSRTWARFFFTHTQKKAPRALFETIKRPEKKVPQKGFDVLAPASWLVCGREVDCDWLKFGRRAWGEIWFCPPLISCKESWRKNKRWAARNNVVLSRAQLIVLILLLQACHVPPAAWME